LDHLQASNRGYHSKFWANLRILGPPCEFQIIFQSASGAAASECLDRPRPGSYEWSLEFQCADNATAAAEASTPSGVIFAAINFYHRLPLVGPLVLPEMEARARARGVGWVLDASPGLTKVDQRECVEKGTYPPTNSSTKMCGQQLAEVGAGR
jgi:hypothetical protein